MWSSLKSAKPRREDWNYVKTQHILGYLNEGQTSWACANIYSYSSLIVLKWCNTIQISWCLLWKHFSERFCNTLLLMHLSYSIFFIYRLVRVKCKYKIKKYNEVYLNWKYCPVCLALYLIIIREILDWSDFVRDWHLKRFTNDLTNM